MVWLMCWNDGGSDQVVSFFFYLWVRFYIEREMFCIPRSISLFSSSALSPASQGNDTDITGAGEKAESSRYSRSYTSGATLGAELRRGRSRRLSSSLQVLKGSLASFGTMRQKPAMGPWWQPAFLFMQHRRCVTCLQVSLSKHKLCVMSIQYWLWMKDTSYVAGLSLFTTN